MTREWLRAGALGMVVVLAGCAGAPPNPAVEAQAPAEPPAQALTACAAQAPSGDGVARLGRAIGYGTLGVCLGALEGAGEGASWAWSTGASRSDGAWIGAAAGAGLGFLIGFVTGLAKVGSGWSPEPTTAPACQAELAEAAVVAESN
jgi:hypothetical protein